MLVGTGLLGIDEAVVAETVPKEKNERILKVLYSSDILML